MDIQAYIQSGIIESYVLGIADQEEVAEVEKLLLQYPEIKHAIDAYSVELENQAFENAVQPPAGVKQKIMAAISQQDSTPVVPMPGVGSDVSSKYAETKPGLQQDDYSTREIKGRNYSFWKYVAAASIILFISSAAYNVYLYNQYQQKSQEYVALLNDRNSLQANNDVFQTTIKQLQSAKEMMSDPAIAKVSMAGIKNNEDAALVLWDTRTKDVYLLANKLPAPTQDKQYQLWAIVDGKPVDAGMLDANCNNVCKMKNIPKAQAFAITLEKRGGSVDPTMEQLFVMGKV